VAQTSNEEEEQYGSANMELNEGKWNWGSVWFVQFAAGTDYGADV
jgi:hypothetical protein